MGNYTQEGRPLIVRTELLGPNDLLLERFTGHEAISELFRFRLELLAEEATPIAFGQVLGRKVQVEIRDAHHQQPRYFHGIVKRLSQGDHVKGAERDTFVRYEAEVVPGLWLLTKRVQCRIFQHRTVPDILLQVLKDEWRLDVVDAIDQQRAPFYPRDYCVQYRESDFAFVSRLMEEEGIFYSFRHTEQGHQLVLGNTPQAHGEASAAVSYEELGGRVFTEDRVHRWVKHQEVAAGKVTLWDSCFELPGQNLAAEKTIPEVVKVGAGRHELRVPSRQPLELYDYPGGYAQRFDGVGLAGEDRAAHLQRIYEDKERTAAIRMEQEEAAAFRIDGASNCRHFAAGQRFNLVRHFHADDTYVLTRVEHTASIQGTYTTSKRQASFSYANRFHCLPANVPFRPARVTPKPTIQGPQTAVVVGPQSDGQESSEQRRQTAGQDRGSFLDKYGRVKVQFPWDRARKFNPESSCWVRVAQTWAGKRWGAFFWPHVGHEVVVAFEEGDPDRPLIVGSVYNAENLPPFDLPQGAPFNGIRSCSLHGDPARNFSGFVFHDSPGDEQFTLHTRGDLYLSAEEDIIANVQGHFHLNEGKSGIDTVGGLFGLLPGGDGDKKNGEEKKKEKPSQQAQEPPPAPAAAPAPAPSASPPSSPPPTKKDVYFKETEVKEGDAVKSDDKYVLTYYDKSNWNWTNKKTGFATAFSPTVAFKSTYGVDGKASFGLSAAFSFGSSWKMAVNPIGLVAELDAAKTFGAIGFLAGLFGGDVGFTVGSGTKFNYGPSYSFLHGRDVKYLPNGEYEKIRPLDKIAKWLAAGIGLTTMAGLVSWCHEAPDRLDATGISLGSTFTGLSAILMAALAYVEHKNYTVINLLKEKDKAAFASLTAPAADTRARIKRQIRLLNQNVTDLQDAVAEATKPSRDVNSIINKIRAKTEVLTDGDWIVKAGKVQLDAFDKDPVVYIRAITSEPGAGQGNIVLAADESTSIQGGVGGVDIRSNDPTGDIDIGGVQMTSGVISLRHGVQRVVLNQTSLKAERFLDVEISALRSITFKVGASQITLDNRGVTIQGLIIKEEATGPVKISGNAVFINSQGPGPVRIDSALPVAGVLIG